MLRALSKLQLNSDCSLSCHIKKLSNNMFFCVAIWWAYFEDFFQKNSIISMKKEKITSKSHCTPKKGIHISTSTHHVASKIQLSLKCRNIFLWTSVDFLMCMRHIKPLAWLIIVFQLFFWFSVLLWKIFPVLAVLSNFLSATQALFWNYVKSITFEKLIEIN